MEFRIIVNVEVPDSVVSMFGDSAVRRALQERITGDRPDFLPDLITSYGITVEGSESDADGTGFIPASRNTPAGVTGLTTAQIARDTRSVRVQSAPVTHDGERRIGRPKTLEGYAASDGGPVREWGNRSPAELKAQGIKVFRPKGSHAAPEPETEPEPTPRKATKKGSAPVVLRRR